MRMRASPGSTSQNGLVSSAVQEGDTANISSSNLNGMTNGHGHEEGTTTGLLQTFDVSPTSSRLLQGVKDVAMLVLITVPFLLLRAARYLLSWLGVTEHR
jgi:hypothetical protein